MHQPAVRLDASIKERPTHSVANCKLMMRFSFLAAAAVLAEAYVVLLVFGVLALVVFAGLSLSHH